MKDAAVIFTIPTYRLRDVAETIEKYDEHFWSNGHSVKIMVFDDSSLANHEKYYALLEQTKTVNDLYYVGPREKEQFIGFLNRRLRDKKLEEIRDATARPNTPNAPMTGGLNPLSDEEIEQRQRIARP